MKTTDAELASGAFIKLLRASSAVSTRAHRPLAQEGLSESQFGVLEALYQRGPLCRRDLAEKILKTGGNITMVVDNLVKRAWVVRKRDQEDRRVVTIHLTAAGRAVIERVYPLMERSIAREMSVLSAEQLATLSILCRKLGLPEQ
ncbi:MAG TPA: MarR family transcriptional regulator [Deferrisomatales bacterium]|nr:MarR family transcriptional regulator [Deferrisomatales bacterium]